MRRLSWRQALAYVGLMTRRRLRGRGSVGGACRNRGKHPGLCPSRVGDALSAEHAQQEDTVRTGRHGDVVEHHRAAGDRGRNRSGRSSGQGRGARRNRGRRSGRLAQQRTESERAVHGHILEPGHSAEGPEGNDHDQRRRGSDEHHRRGGDAMTDLTTKERAQPPPILKRGLVLAAARSASPPPERKRRAATGPFRTSSGCTGGTGGSPFPTASREQRSGSATSAPSRRPV